MSLTSDVDWYILGDYRAYSPILMRFHSPDAASPFGHGGLNAYVYCSGNPVNRSDPSGEGWLEWLFVGIGAVASGIGMVLSAGTLAPALVAAVTLSANLSQAASVGLLAVDLASVGLDIASAKAMDDGNDALAMKLSLGSAVLGHAMFSAAAATAVAPLAAKAFTRGPRYVSQSPVVAPTSLKAPRLRGGHDGSRGFGRIPVRFSTDPSAPRPLSGARIPTAAETAGMSGIERINFAASDPIFRRVLVSRGHASQEVLNYFPDGIDLADQAHVIWARYLLTDGLRGLRGLDASKLSRTGITSTDLMALNPSRAANPAPVRPEEVVQAVAASRLGVSESGEHIYRRFLETRQSDLLDQYAMALSRARTLNLWQNWNIPMPARISRRR
jgi:RHS repeat-associated protein